MAPPIKSFRQGYKDSDESDTPSNILWVGNLAMDVTDSDLMALFARYGALDSITSYSSRSYAFVFFKRMEDAQAAKDALQGAVVRGISIKIEFARPAKPCKSLWVGGIDPAVSKEEVEKEFSNFGKIEDFKFSRHRNAAFIEYFRLEDASQAMRIMNGKHLGGEQICMHFLRSHPSERDHLPDFRDGQFQGRNMGLPDIQSGNKRPLPSHSVEGHRGESQPSNVLLVCYPPSVQIDEQMLHNAMILFGEIENIRSFPSKHYSFVEFRSVDEARRAKEGLQGRLFNDPRITIMFSRPEMLLNEPTFQSSRLDGLSHNHPLMSNNFTGLLPSGAGLGPNMMARPFGRGNVEPLLPGPDFNDFPAPHSLQDANNKSFMGPNLRRLSPSTGILSSPAPGIRSSMRSSINTWDMLEKNQFERDSKRSRVDGTQFMADTAFPSRKIDEQGLGSDQQYRFGSIAEGRAPASFVNATGRNRASPVGANVTSGPVQPHADSDFVWRGMIAKGGTPVCHARCVPIGKGIGSELPEVVNCSARTGLDQLTTHYAEAIGFDVVFFLPDSEDDFASYTEFLHYLGGKNRAGVAKFDNGTTLFLVPPSDFLRKVLKVGGPERLYGVVLNFPQTLNNDPPPPQSNLHISSQYIERKQGEYDLIPSKDERFPLPDYNRALHENSKASPKSYFSSLNESLPAQSMPQEYISSTGSMSQTGVSLTPELIATLASLIPGKNQSSALETSKPPSGSSTIRPSLPPTGLQDQQSDHTGHSFPQMGSHANMQGQSYMQYKSYPAFPSLPSHPAQLLNGSTTMQDSTVSLSQQLPRPPRPLTNYSAPESGQAPISLLPNPQYQQDVSRTTMGAYGVVHGTDLSAQSSMGLQQSNNYMALHNQGQSTNFLQPQTTGQLAADGVNTELPNQMQQLQSAPVGTGNGTSEVEVDKNQRYQSTLQFAASLLQQIQQQQQHQQAARNS